MKTTIGSRQGLATALCTHEVYSFNATCLKDALALTSVRVSEELFPILLALKNDTDTIRMETIIGNSILNSLMESKSALHRAHQSISSSIINSINYISRCLRYLGTPWSFVSDIWLNNYRNTVTRKIK